MIFNQSIEFSKIMRTLGFATGSLECIKSQLNSELAYKIQEAINHLDSVTEQLLKGSFVNE